MTELYDLVEYLCQPDVQEVLTRLAQLVGAVVGLRWASRGAWYAATGAWLAALVCVGRPARWAWRQVSPPPSDEQRQQSVLCHLLGEALDEGCSYDARQGYLVAPPLAVTVGRRVHDAQPIGVERAELHGMPVTEESLGRRGWARFEARVLAAVRAELAAQDAARREEQDVRRKKEREALLDSLASGRKPASAQATVQAQVWTGGGPLPPAGGV